MTIPIIGQTKPKIDVDKLPYLQCEKCGNLYFNTLQKIKMLTPDESKPEHKQLIPQPVLQCDKCKNIIEIG